MTPPPTEPNIEKPKLTNRILTILSFVVIGAGIIWAISLLFNLRGENFTDNAQIDGSINSAVARVQGYISEIRFKANQTVKKGDTLAILVDDEYKIKLRQAEADLENAVSALGVQQVSYEIAQANSATQLASIGAARASYIKTSKDYDRYNNMFNDSAITRNNFDAMTASKESASSNYEAVQKQQTATKLTVQQVLKNIETAKANIKRKEADLDFARLQLSYCTILAPFDGVCGERTVQEGQLINAGQTLVSIVVSNDIWVTANFKEIQMEQLAVGKEVKIKVDAYGDKTFDGVIHSFSPASGAKFSMVPPDNSTGNFVKIIQRIPVRIDFTTDKSELTLLKPGMNVSVYLK
ncbi:MAG TPA: HlyD family secretion protein [Chryseolinea sp.]|nr:HlyD family secretion protein [Chryseolinea sp.]